MSYNRLRGMALILVLLVLAVMLILLATLLSSSRTTSFFTRAHVSNIQALYVAEAGVVDMLARLKATPDWQTDVHEVMPNGEGEYQIVFADHASVNNLQGTAARPGKLGPVPPGAAHLVVVGRAHGKERRLEVWVTRGGGANFIHAISASGRIHLAGSVQVEGVTSLADVTPVDANIYSNASADQEDLIVWSRVDPTDQAVVAGAVKVVSPNPQAINFEAGSNVTNGFQPSSPPAPLPRPDILGEIARKTSANSPTIDTNGVNTLGPGDHYIDGDLVAEGDLILDGANLYVNGEVDLNGTIKGDGAVYVAKNTTFRGDSELNASEHNRIALFSKGNVSLTGFDGTRYLNNLAGPPGTPSGDQWEQTKRVFQRMEEILESPTDDFFGQGSEFDLLGHTLVSDINGAGLPYGSWQGPGSLNVTGGVPHMLALLETQTPGPTRDFLTNRFLFLADDRNDATPYDNHPTKGLFSWVIPYSAAEKDARLAAFDQDGSLTGLIDAANDRNRYDLKSNLRQLIGQLHYDRLGHSFFNGQVYTNGYLYAAHEVTILGALVSDDDGSQVGDSPEPGIDLEPGDVHLGDGTQVTYVDEYFDGGQTTGGQLAVTAWMGR